MKNGFIGVLVLVCCFCVFLSGLITSDEVHALDLFARKTKKTEVTIQKDIVYKDSDGVPLRLDIYHPNEKKKAYPVIFLIHGQGPASILRNIKDHVQFGLLGKAVASAGMAAVVFNYRSAEGFTKTGDAYSDVCDAIRFIRENGKKLGLDVENCGVWTISAGAPFGLKYMAHESADFIKCAVVYYGFLDAASMRLLASAQVSDADLGKVCPLLHMQNNPGCYPPLFMVRAGLDDALINGSIERFVSEAPKCDVQVELYDYPNAAHAFDIYGHSGQTGEVIQKTVDFLKGFVVPK